jgi:heme-degrading monooxygenase HmoA
MHARVLTFTGAKNIDAGVDFARDKALPILKQQKGYRGFNISADRAAGVLGILSLWETEADRDASESALAKVREESLDVIGGELKIETFEELVSEVGSTPPGPGSSLMVTRVSMDPGKIDETVGFFKSDILPRIKASPGFQAVRNMINRTTGEGVTGTAWESADAMKAAADEAMSRRPEAAKRGVSFGDTSYRQILFTDRP